jgi:V8-like Glu-specific endopeptidase
MKTREWSSRVALCAAFVTFGVASVHAQVRKVGENRRFTAESPHPYGRAAAGTPVWTDEVYSSGAAFIRVHFADFRLAGGDYVTVSDLSGSTTWTYRGRGPNGGAAFWSFAVPGETAVVRLYSSTGGGQGYRIDTYAHGTEDVYAVEPDPFSTDVSTKSICGTDGKRDAVCFSSINSRPVARLLFSTGTGQALCTGSLVVAPNANTLLTNNHCMSDQAGVSSLQAIFNFQRTTCGGTTNAATSSYAGGTFLRTSPVDGGLDYTLLTLQGNPEATWGEYRAAGANVGVGRDIYIVQHPGGREKQIARYEDSAQTVPCRIQTVSGTQTSYNCDTEGGSSGSPVLDAATHQIIGLHHFGGCPNNSATMIRQICDHAGTGLLTCGSSTPTPTATATATPTRTATPTGTVTATPTTPPTTNLALNKAATGSAACNANEGPAKAVNGSVTGGNTDKWCSLAAGTKFLQVDLGSSFNVGSFIVRHAGAGGESTGLNTRDFNIQTSTDNATWSTAVTVAGNTGSATSHPIATRAARYVRLNITLPTQTTDAAARIYELEVYAGATAPTNIAVGKPATGSAACNANEGPAKAVNGSVSGGNTDKWCSVAAGTKFLQVDLGASTGISSIVVRHAQAGGESATWNTRTFDLQTSTNGTTFTTVASVAANTAAVTTHAVSATTRFVRLNITAPTQDGSAAARIYELEVYAP